MPGWINTPIRIETRERLAKAKGDKSFDQYIRELLDLADKVYKEEEGKNVKN